jgi:hypothetical protein
VSSNGGFRFRADGGARKKTTFPNPPKRKGIRPRMLVRCPLCERSGVYLTRQGLITHPKGDLDLPNTPDCEASGRRIKMGENGQVALA